MCFENDFKNFIRVPTSLLFLGVLAHLMWIINQVYKQLDACDDHKDYNVLFRYFSVSSCPRIIDLRKSSFPGYHLTQTIVITVVIVWAVGKP